MPDSYSKENRKYFAKFIEHYEFAKSSEKNHHNSFRKALYKNFKIDYLNGYYSRIRDVLYEEKILLDEVQLKRYWWVISTVFPFEWKKTFEWKGWFYDPRSHGIFINSSDDTLKQDDILRHEHFHHLVNMWLIKEHKYDINNKITNESHMRHRIKNEIIAQYSDQSNKKILKHLGTSAIMAHYIISYLGHRESVKLTLWQRNYHKKIWKYLDEFSEQEYDVFQKNPNHDECEIVYCIYEESGQKYSLTENQSLIQDFENYLNKTNNYTFTVWIFMWVLLKNLIPKYFDSYDQILYILAITPLSQWDSLGKYYGWLIWKDKVKSDLSEAIDNRN